MEIDPVILELKAKVDRYQADVRNATRTVDQQFGIQEKRVQRLEREMKRSSGQIGSTIKGLAATFATAFSAQQIIGLVDSFTRLQNSLRVAGLEGEQLAQVQRQLLDLSTRYGVGIEGLADLYGKATDAGRSFGANEAQVLQLTEATSQALLITGTSAAQAQGAILGLSQALASGTVRAEEYNQINEGGLRPLLQAAAASERFGGDINKLRAAMLDGKVSSQEFFNSILAGSAQLESRAANAAITVAGAFEGLTSQLTVYFGEAGKGSGATEALAGAIRALADNLDTIIPLLAVVTAGLGVRMVTAALAGSRALQAVAAYSSIATTSLAGTALAARGAGAALLAALGGPVGAAILALTLTIGYLATRTEELSGVSEEYAKTLRESSNASDKAREAAERLASAHGKTRAEALAAAKAERELTKQKLAGARASLVQAQAELKKAQAFREGQNRASFGAGGVAGTGSFIQGTGDVRVARAEANETAAQQRIKNLGGAITELTNAINGSGPPSVAAVSAGDTKASKTRTARDTGPSEAEIAFRQAQELNRLRAEEIQAQLALTDDATERADLQRELLDLERNSRIADVRANADLSKEQQDAQIEILNRLFGVEASLDEQGNIIANGNRSLYAQAVERERIAQLEREEADLAAERYNNQVEALRLQYDLADTQEQRRAIAFQILDAEDRYLKSKLEAIIASEAATEAEKERARIALEGLNATAGSRREALGRAEAGPLQRYIDSMSDPATKAEEAVVRQLERVNDGITDAISKAIGTDDPFIKELLNILLEEILLKPLAQALQNAQGAGGGGGLLSGLGSVIGSIFGGARAAGGPVSPGSAYLVGERGRELFVPDAPGRIVPNSRLSSSGGGGGVVRIVIDEAPGFATRVETVAQGVAIDVQRRSAPAVIEAAANETLRRASRPTL